MSLFKTIFRNIYYHWYYPIRIWQLRRQDKISVVFRVDNLGAWKSENLYRLMLSHPRFEPQLIISRNNEEDDRDNIRAYCEKNGYEYHEIDGLKESILDNCSPDIIFYQKPYGDTFSNIKQLINHRKTLFVYLPYAFHGSIESWSIETQYLRKCWQIYYENSQLAKEYGSLLKSYRKNSYATGLPVMDELQISKESLEDPWKDSSAPRKRIIYAPHHSINPENWWQSSTFLEMGELMLELAEKYSDRVQWAFKPHPLLRGKLEKVWGKEKTDEYYRRWSDSTWSQYESGKYLGLFKHSDAMIHDCGSFIMEYFYTGNPVMYLMKGNELADTFNSGYKKALNLHYHAWKIDEVETFIKNVINGNDPMKSDRDKFKHDYLNIPNGTSSSQNIIDCILDKKADQRMLAK